MHMLLALPFFFANHVLHYLNALRSKKNALHQAMHMRHAFWLQGEKRCKLHILSPPMHFGAALYDRWTHHILSIGDPGWI
jgi:hypothetical protein